MRRLAITLLGIVGGIVLVASQVYGIRLLSVESGSMVPLLHKGDAVLLRPASLYDARVGDVVSYPNPSVPGAEVAPVDSAVIITHRIVSIDRLTGKVVTKGDGNTTVDPEIDGSRLLGQMAYVIPNFGSVVAMLRTWPGLVLMVYLPMAVILGREFIRLGRYYLTPTYQVRQARGRPSR